jgi:uncharacterized protein
MSAAWWTLSAPSSLAERVPPAAAQRPARPFFLPTTDSAGPGQRFCIHHPSALATPHGQVLYLHPWAEEMNKARRMAAMQSRALAAAGFEVLQIDLQGCGDSSGDFVDATWDGWLADVARAVAWLQNQNPNQAATSAAAVPLWLWGLRAGALLACEAAPLLPMPCHFLFWQPAASGKLVLQQFLRLKAAADMQQAEAKSAAKDTLARLREDLSAGRPIDVAGYRVSAALALGFEKATLALPSATHQVLWLETATQPEAELLPGSITKIDAWREAGHTVHSQVVMGPAFWQTQEIEDAPALIAATVAALQAATSRSSTSPSPSPSPSA